MVIVFLSKPFALKKEKLMGDSCSIKLGRSDMFQTYTTFNCIIKSNYNNPKIPL